MRIRLLSGPIDASFLSDETKGVEFTGYDSSGRKADVFTHCDKNNSEHAELINEMKGGVEVVFTSGKAYNKSK